MKQKKDDMTVDNSYIREFLEIYARRNDYRLSEPRKSLADPLIGERYFGRAENKNCNDLLNIYISIDDDKVTMNHFGDYCALAHASAEIFCELCNNESIEVVLSVVYALEKHFTDAIKTIVPENDKFEMLFALASLQISATRKYCLSLPWRASLSALNKT